jgi:hypothetical protein
MDFYANAPGAQYAQHAHARMPPQPGGAPWWRSWTAIILGACVAIVLVFAIARAQKEPEKPVAAKPSEAAKAPLAMNHQEVRRVVYDTLTQIQEETEQREQQQRGVSSPHTHMAPPPMAPPPMAPPPMAPPPMSAPHIMPASNGPEPNIRNPGPPMKFGDDVPVTAERPPL